MAKCRIGSSSLTWPLSIQVASGDRVAVALMMSVAGRGAVRVRGAGGGGVRAGRQPMTAVAIGGHERVSGGPVGRSIERSTPLTGSTHGTSRRARTRSAKAA